MTLSLVLATLNTRLSLPPFSLLIVALTVRIHHVTLVRVFLNVTDTGKETTRARCSRASTRTYKLRVDRVLVRDWAIDQRVLCGIPVVGVVDGSPC